jgi:nicotinate-nucleotide--dimethylbenzimidazole phosphoribosyltransferase
MTEMIGTVATRTALKEQLQRRIDQRAKPLGSLGRLEELALQLGLIAGSLTPDLGAARILVFAADHGITAEGVTAFPSAVTRDVAKLVLAGTAGINVCARATGADVVLIDAGLLEPLPPHAHLLDRRIRAGTRNARHEPAMTQVECDQALAAGAAIVKNLRSDGVGIIGFGEIGIGNTSASSLIAHAITGIGLAGLIGPGAGAPAAGLEHKRAVLQAAAQRISLGDLKLPDRSREALRQFGGFEIAMMAGAMHAAAEEGQVVIVDGFISTTAALVAVAMQASVRDALVFAHCSAEPGHLMLLDHLDAKPVLELNLRLGEGTGAALAIPLVRAAEYMLRDMADLPSPPLA